MQRSGWLCLAPMVRGPAAGAGKQRALPWTPTSPCCFSHLAASSKQSCCPGALEIRRDSGSSSPGRETAPGGGEPALQQGQLQAARSGSVHPGSPPLQMSKHRAAAIPQFGRSESPERDINKCYHAEGALEKGKRDSKRRLLLLIPWD